MAKPYGKGADFRLSDKFWKEFKPSDVTDTGLGEALRKYEKARGVAEKASSGTLRSSAQYTAAANAWANVIKALTAVQQGLPKVVASIDKAKKKSGIKPADAQSMQNLMDALNKAATQLDHKTHANYVDAFGRQQTLTKQALEAADREAGGAAKEGEAKFREFLKKQKGSKEPEWKNLVRRLTTICPAPLLADLKETTRVMAEWDRDGTLDITGPNSIAKEVKRSVDARLKGFNAFAEARKKALKDHAGNKELLDLLLAIQKGIADDRNWWVKLGKDSQRELDNLRKTAKI
jgi:hypothetical protein